MNNIVLVIEDEAKTGEYLKKALESESIDVDLVSDGPKALAKLEKGKYDLIVLDLKLPEMLGHEVLEHIRKVDPYVEVVIYTNYEEPPVMQKLINLGVDAYIKKGGDADLWETVDTIKRKLDPFSEKEQDDLLDSIPDDIFDPKE